MKAHIICGRQIGPIEFMNRIENIFVKMGKLQAQKERYLVKETFDGRWTTSFIHRQFGLIHRLNPVRSKVQEAPLAMKHGNSSDAPIVSLTRCKSWLGTLQQQR